MDDTCPNCGGEYVPTCPCGDGPDGWQSGDLRQIVADHDALRTRIDEMGYAVHRATEERAQALAERDLLRDRYAAAWALEVKQTAVVEAVRAMLDNIIGTGDFTIAAFPTAYWAAVEKALDQLDVSPTMGGDDAEETR